MKYGERIKELIKNKNITQVQLADIMGVKPSYINQLISGFRKPGRDTLKKLADAFDVPVSIFFEEFPESYQKKIKKKTKHYSPDEQRYINMLIDILRGRNIENTEAIKSNIVAFWKSRNMDNSPQKKSLAD